MDFLTRRNKKGKYNLFEEDNTCKKNDYKCKYEHCERARIQGRPLPSRPARISSGEYATVGSPGRQISPLYLEPEPLYLAPKPLYGNVTMRRVSSPHIYDEIGDSTAGGTRRRKHASKSTHKKRKGGKRTMHKGGKRTMHKGGKRTMRKGGKRKGRRSVYASDKKRGGGDSWEQIIEDFETEFTKKGIRDRPLDNDEKKFNLNNISIDSASSRQCAIKQHVRDFLDNDDKTNKNSCLVEVNGFTVPLNRSITVNRNISPTYDRLQRQHVTTGLPPDIRATVRTENKLNKQNLYEAITPLSVINYNNKRKTQRRSSPVRPDRPYDFRPPLPPRNQTRI